MLRVPEEDEDTNMRTGYPMAKNLRAKIPEGDSMTVFDVNTAAVERFVKEAEPSNVTVAKAPREVVENSVRTPFHSAHILHDESYCSIDDLSWGLRALPVISPTIKANPLKQTPTPKTLCHIRLQDCS